MGLFKVTAVHSDWSASAGGLIKSHMFTFATFNRFTERRIIEWFLAINGLNAVAPFSGPDFIK